MLLRNPPLDYRGVLTKEVFTKGILSLYEVPCTGTVPVPVGYGNVRYCTVPYGTVRFGTLLIPNAGMQLGIIPGYPRIGISPGFPRILKNTRIYMKFLVFSLLFRQKLTLIINYKHFKIMPLLNITQKA